MNARLHRSCCTLLNCIAAKILHNMDSSAAHACMCDTQCVHPLVEPSEEERTGGDIVFFHGLQPRGDYRAAWKDTWTAGRSCWPIDYLAHQLEQPVRVLSVAYDSRLTIGRGTFEALAESLFASLVLTEDVGQRRPVVLVGHSLGGLMIKQVCIAAHHRAVQQGDCSPGEERDRRKAQIFLKKLRLVAFFATPHAGSRAADFLQRQRWQRLTWSPLLNLLTTMSEKSAQLHAEFMGISRQFSWTLQSFGERNPVKVVRAPSPRLLACVDWRLPMLQIERCLTCYDPQQHRKASAVLSMQLVLNKVIVDEESACGGMPQTYMGCSGYNHIDIAAPADAATAPQCIRLLKLVKDALTDELGAACPELDRMYPRMQNVERAMRDCRMT